MDRHYFLHTESMNTANYDDFRSGLSQLTAIYSSKETNDIVLKHDNIYYSPHYVELLSDPSNVKAILQFIEQCHNHTVDIVNDPQFEEEFPISNVGFMGVDFSTIDGVMLDRQITSRDSFHCCKREFCHKLLSHSALHLEESLRYLYPTYVFESRAITDWIDWQKLDERKIIEKIITLLDDIEPNPFSGGIGQTEVLKYESGMCSKRINKEHRLTYTKGTYGATIHQCKEHY